MSPEMPEPTVPLTAWEVIASPASLMSVQLEPRVPSALLKSSEALAVVELLVQVTVTLVTLDAPMLPVPLETAQVWPVGLVFTVTAYAAPVGSCVAKVNGPFAPSARLSPLLSCSTTVPDNPDTVPPTE